MQVWIEDDLPELAGDTGGARHGARTRHIVLAVRLIEEGLATLGCLQDEKTTSIGALVKIYMRG